MKKPIHQSAWHLPWRGAEVPHAVVDITRRCSITCRSCYNTDQGADKPLDEVKAEIRGLCSLRRLQSISIVGGEPLLHPGLHEIIRFIRGRGLHAELFTNGVLLDQETVPALARSGLDMAFVHLQTGQSRPDLPEGYSLSDAKELLGAKVALLHRHGIESGLTITAYPDRPDELAWAVDSCLALPQLGYLLVTLDRDVRRISLLEGGIAGGMTCPDPAAGSAGYPEEGFDMTTLVETMQRDKGLRPFFYLGSNLDRLDPRWVSFMEVCGYRRELLAERLSMGPSLVEKLYLRIEAALKGRYPFYSRQRPGILKLQLLLNALSGGSFAANIGFLAKSLGAGVEVSSKRILFQSLAYVGRDGRLVHCASCPDAVLKNGRLVPLCISDRVRG